MAHEYRSLGTVSGQGLAARAAQYAHEWAWEAYLEAQPRETKWTDIWAHIQPKPKPSSCPACKGYMVVECEDYCGPGKEWMCVECGTHWDA
jgi:hypothetical protein